MKKMMLEQGLLAGLAIFLLAALLPAIATAQDARTYEVRQNSQQSQTEVQQKAADRKEADRAKLEDGQLNACQNRQKRITNIMARIADRGQKQINLFSTIAQRIEKFYADKGKTLVNYATLESDVATKKTAAQAAVDVLKSGSVTFDCTGDNPRAAAANFKENLKNEIEILKVYKASVRSLIVGVKSVQGTSSSEGRQQ